MKINWISKTFSAFKKDESGVTAIEYGLIAAMVGVAIIGGVTLLGDSLDQMFTDVSTTLDNASSGIGGDAGGGEEGGGEEGGGEETPPAE